MKKVMILAMGLVVCGMRAEDDDKGKDKLLYHMVVTGTGKRPGNSSIVAKDSNHILHYTTRKAPYNQTHEYALLTKKIQEEKDELSKKYESIDVREIYNYFKKQENAQKYAQSWIVA